MQLRVVSYSDVVACCHVLLAPDFVMVSVQVLDHLNLRLDSFLSNLLLCHWSLLLLYHF